MAKKIGKATKALSLGASTIGAAVSFQVGGAEGVMIGSALTAVVKDIGRRLLSPKEISRIERVRREAEEKIIANLNKGSKPRKDLRKELLEELLEGTLLLARKTYEEKKLPYISNLLATTPFTNTPIENMSHTLQVAERLSYRQLCLLAIIDKQEYGDIGLSNKPFNEEKGKHHNELAKGIYQDLNLMIVDGIIAMVVSKEAGAMMAAGVGFIVPTELKLLYPGDLLVNGMGLSGIPSSETKPLIKMLKGR